MADSQTAADVTSAATPNDQVQDQEPQGQPVAAEAYFEYVRPDGQKEAFKSREELAQEWKLRGLREDDYRRKTQSVAEERREIERSRKEFQDELKAFQKTKGQYDEWDQRLRGMDPRQYAQLQQALSEPVAPEHLLTQSREYADTTAEELRNELKELKTAWEREQQEKVLNSAFDDLGKQFPDFDRDSVLGLMDSLAEDNPKFLAETLYYALRGKNPGAVEARVANNFKKKAAAGMMPAAGSRTNGAKPSFNSIKEARDYALEAEGLTSGSDDE
jgi:hypothetical protein